MSTRRLLSALLPLALLALPAAASAAGTGEIGGPPTDNWNDLRHQGKVPKGFPKARSEPIVIGVGTNISGRVEIVGQDSTYGLCITVDYIDAGSGQGGCPEEPPTEVAIQIDSFGYSSSGPHERSASISGPGRADVTAVTTLVEKNHRRKYIRAVVANPDASILSRLHQQPFSFFDSHFRGCAPPYKTLSVAYDANGQELQRLRGPSRKRFGNPCRRSHRGSTVVAPPPGASGARASSEPQGFRWRWGAGSVGP